MPVFLCFLLKLKAVKIEIAAFQHLLGAVVNNERQITKIFNKFFLQENKNNYKIKHYLCYRYQLILKN